MGGCFGAKSKKFGKAPSSSRIIQISSVSNRTILDNVSNHYEFVKVLGHGHFGVVREARPLSTTSRAKTSYAIKSLRKNDMKGEL